MPFIEIESTIYDALSKGVRLTLLSKRVKLTLATSAGLP